VTELLDLSSEQYVRLTTFRRDGTPVGTPVWLVRGEGELLVITGSTTGKVKRLRHTRRVLVAACDARGRLTPGVVEHEGLADLVEDPAEAERIGQAVTRGYGLLGRLLAVVERLRGGRGRQPVGIRIRPA
jgi:uncharacterized protein